MLIYHLFDTVSALRWLYRFKAKKKKKEKLAKTSQLTVKEKVDIDVAMQKEKKKDRLGILSTLPVACATYAFFLNVKCFSRDYQRLTCESAQAGDLINSDWQSAISGVMQMQPAQAVLFQHCRSFLLRSISQLRIISPKRHL